MSKEKRIAGIPKGLTDITGQFEPGMIYTFIGASGLGKTSLLLCQLPLVIYKDLIHQGKLSDSARFVLINTDGSFLFPRLAQVASALGVDVVEFRKYSIMVSPSSQTRQHRLLTRDLPELVETENLKPVYIGLDPMNHWIRYEFARAPANYRLMVAGRRIPELEYEMNVLHRLTRDKKCVTTVSVLPKKYHAVERPDKWQTAYFGPLEIAHLSDVVLWLTPVKLERDKVDIEVVKHRKGRVSPPKRFKLNECGLVDV